VSLTGEFFTLTASAQISLVAITAFLGYAATGGIRGAQALLGPTTTLFNALRIAVVPEIIRFGGSGTAAGRRTIRITEVGAVAVAATATVVLLLLPDAAGRALLGKTWPETSGVLLPICVSRLAFAFTTRALISLRADRRLHELVVARTLSVFVVDLPTAIAAATRDIHVTAWTLAVGAIAQLAVLEWVERSPRRSRPDQST
jgi:O-antigen/teichoic acid export membrane protein